MARSEGLEPPAYKFVACCSIQLSYDRAAALRASPFLAVALPSLRMRYQSVSGGRYECFSCMKYFLPRLDVIGTNGIGA
jgi:hypothetical protein